MKYVHASFIAFIAAVGVFTTMALFPVAPILAGLCFVCTTGCVAFEVKALLA